MLIREATRGDIPEVIEFLRRSAATPGVGDNAEALARVIDADHAWLFVAVDDDRIVGTIIAGWDSWRAALYRLAVDEAHRRRGIARALVERAEDRLRTAGARRVGALVFRSEEGAQGFWRSAGFREDGRVMRFVKDS